MSNKWFDMRVIHVMVKIYFDSVWQVIPVWFITLWQITGIPDSISWCHIHLAWHLLHNTSWWVNQIRQAVDWHSAQVKSCVVYSSPVPGLTGNVKAVFVRKINNNSYALAICNLYYTLRNKSLNKCRKYPSNGFKRNWLSPVPMWHRGHISLCNWPTSLHKK